MTLPSGLYDLLLTESLAQRLEPDRAQLQTLTAEATQPLVEALTQQLARLLDDLPGDDGERTAQQLALVNSLLVGLRQRLAAEHGSATADIVDLIASPAQRLTAIQRDGHFDTPPALGLAAPWLFTAGKGSPSLLQEIRRELASADRVDILVSFITVSGVRKLRDVLEAITAVGAASAGTARLRILTTTYTGATEARALDELARLPGCEVRVSLDGRRTRLHAKAWLFQRRTGFGSAYVGSANLSGAALTGGLEWTVKLTQRAQAELFERACAHFETLWADREFQPYDPADAEASAGAGRSPAARAARPGGV